MSNIIPIFMTIAALWVALSIVKSIKELINIKSKKTCHKKKDY